MGTERKAQAPAPSQAETLSPFKKLHWGALLVVSTVALLFSSPIVSATPTSLPLLGALCHLPFLLVVWAFAWGGTGIGLITGTWACLLVGMVTLASREAALLWLPLELLGLGFIAYAGARAWKHQLQERLIRSDRLTEAVNTLEGELQEQRVHMTAMRERLNRYQKLRQSANAFSLTLSQEGLLDCIAQASGDLVGGADRVLLYLADTSTLTMGLKTVWRKSGDESIRAKRGDPFDHWVMRQRQPLLVQTPATDFRFPNMTPEKLGRPMEALIAVPLVSEHRFLGVLRLESERTQGLSADDLRLVRFIGDMASLAIENNRLYQRTEQLAITDDLTGLAVRRHFQSRMEEVLGQAKRQAHPVSLLLIDIDRFKSYNDTFGHSAGDKLLRQMGQLLLQDRKGKRIAGRMGGEEFAILLPKAAAAEAVKQAELLRLKVENTPVELRRSLTKTTISVGVATFPQDGSEVLPLLQKADERLYRAKALGRNQVCHA